MADLFESAWSRRISLPEERPPQPTDFLGRDKEQSLRVLQPPLASAASIAHPPPQLLVLLCEHLLLPSQLDSDNLGLPEEGEDIGGDDEMLWSTEEHRRLAEEALKVVLATQNVASLTQLLGKQGQQQINILTGKRKNGPLPNVVK